MDRCKTNFRFIRSRAYEEVDLGVSQGESLTMGLVIWDPEALETDMLVRDNILPQELLAELVEQYRGAFVKDVNELILIVHRHRDPWYMAYPLIISGNDEEGGRVEWGLYMAPPRIGFVPDYGGDKGPVHVSMAATLIGVTDWMPVFCRNDRAVVCMRDKQAMMNRHNLPVLAGAPADAALH
jgi:hypothetical protein